MNVKHGQIAHLDHDRTNNKEDNLAFLCLSHHSEYDSRTSQHKNFTIAEAKEARRTLHEVVASTKTSWERTLVVSNTSSDPDVTTFNALADHLSKHLVGSNLTTDPLAPGLVRVTIQSSLETFDTLTTALEQSTVPTVMGLRIVEATFSVGNSESAIPHESQPVQPVMNSGSLRGDGLPAKDLADSSPHSDETIRGSSSGKAPKSEQMLSIDSVPTGSKRYTLHRLIRQLQASTFDEETANKLAQMDAKANGHSFVCKSDVKEVYFKGVDPNTHVFQSRFNPDIEALYVVVRITVTGPNSRSGQICGWFETSSEEQAQKILFNSL